MRILALDERLGRIRQKVFLTVVRRSIHRTEDIRIVVQFCTFILHRTGAVIRFYPIVHSLEILSVSGLVTHTPDDNGRMIEIPEYHTFVTDKMSLEIVLSMRQRGIAVTHSVRFDIRFIHNVQSVFVAE